MINTNPARVYEPTSKVHLFELSPKQEDLLSSIGLIIQCSECTAEKGYTVYHLGNENEHPVVEAYLQWEWLQGR